MAHANAVTGSTHYVAEGDPVPAGLHPDVRLVGPGAFVAESVPEPEPEVLPGPQPSSTPGESSPVSSDPGNYAASTILLLRDVCRERGLSPAGAKADLVMRLNEHDLQAVA